VNPFARLSDDRRQHALSRLRSNLMIWLTTVDPSGRPHSVPVWFLLRDDETLLLYSQPDKPKLGHLQANPYVTLGLDVTDIGRDIVRVDGRGVHDPRVGPADQQPDYVAKYTERIGALFDTPEEFGRMFSCPIVVTPDRVWVSTGARRSLT
jgi:PPOX class probable F420-dependent enzyme